VEEQPTSLFASSSALSAQALPSLSVVEELVGICSSNLIQISTDKEGPVFAVTAEGVDLLMIRLGLSEAELHQTAMLPTLAIDDTLKRQLLFGLLMRRGWLTLIKEDGVIVAPLPEISLPPSSHFRGKVSFRERYDLGTSHGTPNLRAFCRKRIRPVHQLIHFLLEKLMALPVEESLLDSFQLKSYSSVTNTLFCRGESLTDFFTATVETEDGLSALRGRLTDKGAIQVGQDPNGDSSLHYVRALGVTREGSLLFTLPISYELIYTPRWTPVSRKDELKRLKLNLAEDQRDRLVRKGFTIEPIS
jgi:hypothetical protein